VVREDKLSCFCHQKVDLLPRASHNHSFSLGEVPCGNSVDETEPKLSKAYEEAMAVLRFQPDRLGHALLLPDSLQCMLDESRIPIETCPTSNVMTLELATCFQGNLIEGLKRHPRLKNWLETDYPISVSTDDSGVFHTDPTKELLLMAVAYNLDEGALKKIVLASMDHAFCDDATKSALVMMIRRRFDALTLASVGKQKLI